jgi:hypothetical protein
MQTHIWLTELLIHPLPAFQVGKSSAYLPDRWLQLLYTLCKLALVCLDERPDNMAYRFEEF